ncbi:MAG: 23S rRNA (uracil(1939)-C(5))-methyltransferase RlmD [Stagnimonas sp.]|nr:23S rRNA (uracil(1939)-C(5))-methyltransferase RlmD [Stagnimonas sp.]
MVRKRSLPQGSYTAEVTGLDHEGRGVARLDGKVSFIADALPGETVEFRYTGRWRDHDEGQVTAVKLASPDRVTPPCAHFGVCGGCALQHLAPEQQIVWKQSELLNSLARIGRVEPREVVPPLTGSNLGYRRRARLGVKFVERKGGSLVGFRERGCSFLATLDACVVLDPRVGLKLKAIAQMIDRLAIRQAIPQIEMAAAEHVTLVFRVLQNPSEQDREILAAFAAEHDFEVLLQPGGLDSIQPLSGPRRELSYSPDGSAARLSFLPADFIQVNGALSQAMVRQAIAWLAPQPGEAVLELFAGLGNFTVPLAKTGAQVTAVEGDTGLVARGAANCAANGVGQVRWHVADLFKPDPKAEYLRQRYPAVLIDPPRAGAQEIMPLLIANKAQRILYVSCHPGTLARDAALLAAGGYTLRKAGAMDMFPHTSHVESMALFER